jgi:hypothetical protein
MAGNFAYMQKKGEKIIKVPLNQWAGYRRKGFEFSNEAEFNAQQSNRVKEEVEEEEVTEIVAPTVDGNSKEEILDFAEAHNIEVDPDDKKADLVEAINDALEDLDD